MSTESLDAIWAGTVTGYQLDLAAHSCRLDVRVLDGGQTRTYTLTITGVSSFQFTDAAGAAWDYIELTSIRAERTSSRGGQVWRLAIELWNAELDILCAAWTLQAV